MLSLINETSRQATGARPPAGSLLREGASRNPAIQLRTSILPEVFHPIASSRVEETTTHPYSSCRQPDAACRGRIAFGVFGFILGFMFILPLILAGIAVKFG